jgi:hypothetical protein
MLVFNSFFCKGKSRDPEVLVCARRRPGSSLTPRREGGCHPNQYRRLGRRRLGPVGPPGPRRSARFVYEPQDQRFSISEHRDRRDALEADRTELQPADPRRTHRRDGARPRRTHHPERHRRQVQAVGRKLQECPADGSGRRAAQERERQNPRCPADRRGDHRQVRHRLLPSRDQDLQGERHDRGVQRNAARDRVQPIRTARLRRRIPQRQHVLQAGAGSRQRPAVNRPRAAAGVRAPNA